MDPAVQRTSPQTRPPTMEPAAANFHPLDPSTGVAPLSPICRTAVLCLTAMLLLPFRLLLLLTCAWLACACAFLAGDRTEQRCAPKWLTAVLRLLGRLCLLACGVWPGLLTVHGKQEDAPVLVVAPHCGALDMLFFMAHGLPRPVAKAPYARLPILGALFRAAGGIAVPLPVAPAGAVPSCRKVSPKPDEPRGADTVSGAAKPSAVQSVTHAVREAILEHKQRFKSGDTPIGILPEGTTHNGCGLLLFFSGAFEGGSPVQPVTLRYPFKRQNSAAFLTTIPSHCLRLLLAPWVEMEVSFLPTYVPSEKERANPELMAEAVRVRMAAALGLPLHAIGARELRKEAAAHSSEQSKPAQASAERRPLLQRMRADRRAASGPRAFSSRGSADAS